MEGGGRGRGGGVAELEDRGERTVVCCQSVSLQSVSAALIKDASVWDA